MNTPKNLPIEPKVAPSLQYAVNCGPESLRAGLPATPYPQPPCPVRSVRGPRLFPHALVLVLLAAAWITAHPTWAQSALPVDFGVRTEDAYTQFKERLFAAETVRVDYIGNPRPRVYGGLVGLLAFAEANPLATPGQLSAFLERWDFTLRLAVADDPELAGPGSLALAVRYRGFVEPSEDLLGTDTRVGLRALRLLGLDPGPARSHELFSNEKKRTSLIEQAARLDLRYSAAAADVVLLAVQGRTADGRAVNGLSEAAIAYLRDDGLGAFNPQTPQDDPRWADLRESWEDLPATLAEAASLLDGSSFENQLAGEFEQLNNLAQAAVGRIREAIPPDDGIPVPTLLQTFEENRDNPATLSDALAGFVSQREAIARRHASFEFRARVFAVSAAFAEQQDRRLSAEEFRRMGSSQASGNDVLAGIETGIKIGQAVSGFASGNPLDMAGAALDLAGLFGLGGPSAEEQILEQLGALQDQLTLFREETLDRLETIDGKLNAIYQVLAVGFGNVLNNQQDMLSRLANLKQAVAEQTVALRRFESRLFAVIKFEQEMNFDDLFNANLFQSIGFDRFRDTIGPFESWAVARARGPVFSPPAKGHASQAASLLPDDADQQLNYLNAYSIELGGPPLVVGTSLANPRVYAKAADAYGLLMEQHPWYAAAQVEEVFVTAVERLRAPGVDLVTAAARAGAVTEGTGMIDAALANYRVALEGLERSLYAPDPSPQGEGVVFPRLFAGNSLSVIPLLEFNQPENFSTGFEPLRRIPLRPRFAAEDFEVIEKFINNESIHCETHWFGDEDDESCGNDNLPGCTDPNLGLFVHEVDFGTGTPPRGLGVVSDALRTLWRLGLVESHTANAYVKTVGSEAGGNAIDIDLEIQAVVPTIVLEKQNDCGRSLGPRGTIESDVQIRILAGGFSPPLDGLLQRLVQDRPDVLFSWLDDPLAHIGQPSGSVEFDNAPLDPAFNETVEGPFTLTLAEVTVEYDELGDRVALLQQQFFDLFEPHPVTGATPEIADLLEPQLTQLESAFLVLRSLVEFGRPDAVQRSKVARTAFDGERVSSVGLSSKNATEFIRAHSGLGAPLPRLDDLFNRVQALEQDVGVSTDGEGLVEIGRHYAVQWALANLEAQRRDRKRLATPDTFTVVAGQTLEITTEDLLANDARHYGEPAVALVARQALLSDAGCENTAGATQAAGRGSISVATTEADAGKTLIFSYVAEGSFGNPQWTVSSEPACVVIRVLPAVDRIRLGGVWQADRFLLNIDGPAGTTVLIQRSADLIQWGDVEEFTLGDGPSTVEDLAVAEIQFYRAAIR